MYRFIKTNGIIEKIFKISRSKLFEYCLHIRVDEWKCNCKFGRL